MAGNQQWLGFEFHGFDGPAALAYSLDNSGHRHALNYEVCATLMNGQRYANNDPPADNGDHKEFERLVVSDDVYIGMEDDGDVVELGGWLGYTPDPLLRTTEQPVSDLKVRHDIKLPVREINGGARFRRRIVLPASLVQPGDTIYHFLEYKSLPNMEYRQKASVLAERAAAAAAAAEAAENEGGPDDAAGAAENEGGPDDAADIDDDEVGLAAEVAQIAAPIHWEDIVQNYNSSSDEDYEPDEDEGSDSDQSSE